MKITLEEHTIRELIDGYKDSAEEGVVGFGGKLNIRPAYQREFIYKEKESKEVIKSIMRGFPINSMYWVKNSDDSYELLDGQQRTVSICQYCTKPISVLINGSPKGFNNLTPTEKERFLDYKLLIYVCEGDTDEKIEWFQIINIANKVLTDQELRNAIYCGEWVTDAKKRFSKSNCPAYSNAREYLSGEMNRQAYLETAIEWISDKEHISVKDYMANHQHDPSAQPLWDYFELVINWVKEVFPHYREEMKGVEWGILYNKYGHKKYTSNDIEHFECRIKELMIDNEVKNKKGIYEYVLGGEKKAVRKCLNLRKFSDSDISTAYERQDGKCAICGKQIRKDNMHADHITPWVAGGKTEFSNLQMLCRDCNLKKSSQEQ